MSPTLGPCYECEIRDGGKAIQQIIFCPLHAQAGAMREGLRNLLGDWKKCPRCGQTTAHPVVQERSCVDVFAGEARAILKEIER